MQYICENGAVRKITDEEYEQMQEAAKTYVQKRKEGYPPIGDQLDAILKYLESKEDLTVELSGVIQEWKQVKDTYPKPKE
jgi:hypothetical protein